MQNESWIKLYRKVALNGIIADHAAWCLFTWMLLTCNRKGEVIVSRFITSQALDMDPSTFYRALKRLSEKWNTITVKSNNKFSVIQIVNWDKYQNEKEVLNNKRTTNEQQTNTPLLYTRIENRERHSLSFLQNIPQEDLLFLKAGLSVSDVQIRDKAEDLFNYCQSKGKVYKDYRAFLRNALKKDYPKDNHKSL